MRIFERSEDHDDFFRERVGTLVDERGEATTTAYASPIPVSQEDLTTEMNEVLLDGRHWHSEIGGDVAMEETLGTLITDGHALALDTERWMMLRGEPTEYDDEKLAETLRRAARDTATKLSAVDQV